MRIKYYKDRYKDFWACIYKSDGTFTHYFIGTKNIDSRKARMYSIINDL